MEKTCILDLDINGLTEWMFTHHEPAFRGKQLSEWLFHHKVTTFDEMTNLNKTLRSALSKEFVILPAEIQKEHVSTDGTRKYLLAYPDSLAAEAVYLSHEKHYTFCISSQIGCALGCRFCATGQLGILRNLGIGEILSQVILLQKHLGLQEKGNIVFMGMGEPLLNSGNVIAAIRTLTAPWGLDWSPRRITISTAGIVPEIIRLGRENLGVNLAISLNASDDTTRNRLMPINRKYPLKQLMAVLREFPLRTKQQKITIEYILIRGSNDSEEDAARLAKLLDTHRFKVNLIPINPVNGKRFQAPEENQILLFQKHLHDRGYIVRIRQSHGQDINAACGQLANIMEHTRGA